MQLYSLIYQTVRSRPLLYDLGPAKKSPSKVAEVLKVNKGFHIFLHAIGGLYIE